MLSSYFDEWSKIAEQFPHQKKIDEATEKAEAVGKKEVKRVARRTARRAMTPAYDDLLRTVVRGIRRSPIKIAAIAQRDLEQAAEKAEKAGKTVGGLVGHSEAHMLARKGIKAVAEPGYAQLVDVVARQLRKMPIKAAQLQQQRQFQGQMNSFLKDLQRTVRTKPNIFGESWKRRAEIINFPQQKMGSSKTKSWKDVVRLVKGLKAHKKITIRKYQLAHPSDAGFKKSWGWPTGQKADWRLKQDGASIHVREHPDKFIIHGDRAHPEGVLGTLKHFALDLPGLSIPLGLAGVGGAVTAASYAKGKKKSKKDEELLQKALGGDQKAVKDIEDKMVKKYIFSRGRAKKHIGRAVEGNEKSKEKVRRRLQELHGAYSGLKEVKPTRLGIPLTLLGGARR